MPVPACWPVLVCSKCRNNLSWSSGEMPGPVSSISTRRRGPVALLAVSAHAQADAALLGKLDGVAQHVDEDLTQLVDIGHDVLGDVADHLHRERQLFLIRADAEHHLQVFEQDGQVERGGVQGRAARFDLGHLQDVVDQGQQMLAAAVDGSQVLALAGR